MKQQTASLASSLDQLSRSLSGVVTIISHPGTEYGSSEDRRAYIVNLFETFANAIIHNRKSDITNLKKLTDKDINESFDYLKEKNLISLFGIHARSKLFNKGRYTSIQSGDIAKDRNVHGTKQQKIDVSTKFHEELLDIYFYLYGRFNTFNERLLILAHHYNRPIIFTCQFESRIRKALQFNIVEEEHKVREGGTETIDLVEVKINKNLLECLLAKGNYGCLSNSIIQSIMKTKDVENRFERLIMQLLTLRRERYNERSDAAVKRALMQYSASIDSENWMAILRYIYPLKYTENMHSKEYWFVDNERLMYELFLWLQGLLLYSMFASNSITSIVYPDKEDIKSALAITIGFNEYYNSKDIRKKLLNRRYPKTLTDINKKLNPLFENKSTENTHGNSERIKVIDDKLIDGIKEALGSTETEPGIMIRLIDRFQSVLFLAQRICHLKHEGERLNYIFYIGNQTHMSYFNDMPVEKDEICMNYYDEKELIKMLEVIKANYSIFQSNNVGLFLGEDEYKNVSVVEFMQPKWNNRAGDSVYKGNGNSVIKEISRVARDLLVVSAGSERIYAYINDTCVLAWPGTENSFWIPDAAESWNSHRKVKSIIKEYADRRQVNGDVNGEALADNLADVIMTISAHPNWGALFLFTDEEYRGERNDAEYLVEQYSIEMNRLALRWFKKPHYELLNIGELVNLSVQDGATVINVRTGHIKCQQQLIPFKDNWAYSGSNENIESCKGTRHRTAMAITEIMPKSIAVVVSSDGPISVYDNGRSITPGKMNRSSQ